MKVRLSDEARLELDAIAVWLEAERAGLGEDFIDAYLQIVAGIERNPQMYEEVRRGVRRARLRRFGYRFYYLIENSTAVIVAILHDRQDRSDWEVHERALAELDRRLALSRASTVRLEPAKEAIERIFRKS